MAAPESSKDFINNYRNLEINNKLNNEVLSAPDFSKTLNSFNALGSLGKNPQTKLNSPEAEQLKSFYNNYKPIIESVSPIPKTSPQSSNLNSEETENTLPSSNLPPFSNLQDINQTSTVNAPQIQESKDEVKSPKSEKSIDVDNIEPVDVPSEDETTLSDYGLEDSPNLSEEDTAQVKDIVDTEQFSSPEQEEKTFQTFTDNPKVQNYVLQSPREQMLQTALGKQLELIAQRYQQIPDNPQNMQVGQSFTQGDGLYQCPVSGVPTSRPSFFKRLITSIKYLFGKIDKPQVEAEISGLNRQDTLQQIQQQSPYYGVPAIRPQQFPQYPNLNFAQNLQPLNYSNTSPIASDVYTPYNQMPPVLPRPIPQTLTQSNVIQTSPNQMTERLTTPSGVHETPVKYVGSPYLASLSTQQNSIPSTPQI